VVAPSSHGEDWTKVGAEVPIGSLVRLELRKARIDDKGVTAQVIATDGPFGNLITNLDADDFLLLGYQRGQDVSVKLGTKEMKIKFVRTFSDVAVGDPLLYIDSRGHVALAVNQGNFSEAYRVTTPVELFVPRMGK
jgi:S-adenosylmethionine hydrolase